MDSLTFVGNATTILRLGSFTILTDPNFLHRGQRAYLGKGLWTRRLTEPSVQPAELPPLDLVVLSHLHGDHFDRIARRGLDHSVPLVSTEHAAKRLKRYGFQTRGLPTWERHAMTKGEETVTVESVPGIHARGLMRALLPPVMGSIVEHRVAGEVTRRLYLSGDTLTGAHLEEIRRRHPDIDLAVVHLGGTRVLFRTVTMDGTQGVDFLRRVRPARTVPVHYDDYRAFHSPLQDFLTELRRSGLPIPVRTPGRGETVELDDPWS